MAILYTEQEVENAQLRGLVSMYLISQKIQDGFYYFNNPIYTIYKNLQYDIYCLVTTIGNENAYVTYDANPTTYEAMFYSLVGALINKTKQFDVLGQMGGAINPYYQSPGNPIVIVDGGGSGQGALTIEKDQDDLIDAGGGNWYLPFTDENNNPITGAVPLSVLSNGDSFTFTFSTDEFPYRIYGFGSNDTQTISVTYVTASPSPAPDLDVFPMIFPFTLS